jgi:hypothetical protein
MKLYISPILASKGGVIETTKMVGPGENDPKNTEFINRLAPGSVGFQL